MSLGFPTRSDTNQAIQKMAKDLGSSEKVLSL